MEWVKWLFDGVGGLILVGVVGWALNFILQRPKQLQLAPGGSVSRNSTGMGRVSFEYLPESPLGKGWKLADPKKPSLSVSVPADRPDGLRIEAEDAIDYSVKKYQRVCNRVEFTANLSENSYVYARVRLVSKDGQTVSRDGWITCDTGDRPPRRESRDEWVIHRMPDSSGWTKFDLFLPGQVSQTFGQAGGLHFAELLGFRLRGSVSISPIGLFRDDLQSACADANRGAASRKREPWSRGDKIASCVLMVAILAIIVGLTNPEVRRILGLEGPHTGQNSPPVTTRQPSGGETSDFREKATESSSTPTPKPSDRSTGSRRYSKQNPPTQTQGPVAIAPNGIANAAPNFGSQTVLNIPPSRALSDKALSDFVAVLSKEKGVLRVVPASSADDAFELAQQLCAAAQKANWSHACPTSRDSSLGAAVVVHGLECYSENWEARDAVAFKQAMETAHLTCSYFPRAYSFGGVTILGTSGVTIVIGSPSQP